MRDEIENELNGNTLSEEALTNMKQLHNFVLEVRIGSEPFIYNMMIAWICIACACAFMDACVSAFAHTCGSAFMDARVCAFYVCVCICVLECLRVHNHGCACALIQSCVCVFVYACACAYMLSSHVHIRIDVFVRDHACVRVRIRA